MAKVSLGHMKTPSAAMQKQKGLTEPEGCHAGPSLGHALPQTLPGEVLKCMGLACAPPLLPLLLWDIHRHFCYSAACKSTNVGRFWRTAILTSSLLPGY